jgi:callose synthase
MVIVAWSPSGSIAALFDEDVFRSVLSIFITSAFLNLLQGTGIILWYLKFFLHVTIVLVGICVLIHKIKDSFDICVPVRNYCIGF